MNLNDKKAYEKRIKEQEERIRQLEAEFKWAYSELAKRIGVKI
jgi:DNA-binding ferritin-like protein (Dps family)